MKDIHGVIIKAGYKVKTQQQGGGIFSPDEPKIGTVEKTKDAFGNNALQIRYRNPLRSFDSFILLNGKINEIVERN